MPGLVAMLVLASGLRLFGLGDLPNAEAIRHNIAFYEDRCELTCKGKPELVKVKRIICRALSEKNIRRWDQWDAEGGALCTYSYAIPNTDGRESWNRVTEVFILRRWGCGDEGQEADLWCFTWNAYEPVPDSIGKKE